MGMGDTIAAEPFCFVACRPHLGRGQFEAAGFAGDGEDGASGAQLDEIGTVFDQVPGARRRLGGAADFADAEFGADDGAGFGAGHRAAAARDGDVTARNRHPRPVELPGFDGIAQRDVGQAAINADIADAGEAGAQGDARGFHGLEDRHFGGVVQRFGGIVALGKAIGDMGMDVDQAGQDGVW